MPRILFAELPDQARVWIFAADRPMDDREQVVILAATDEFLDGWAAHGTSLTCARDLRYGQFLLIAVDEAATDASGCSVDAMVHNLKRLERELDLRLVDHSSVQYRADGAVRRLARAEFAELVAAGDIGPQTTVFNNTVPTVGDVRAGRWETSASESWHAQAFF